MIVLTPRFALLAVLASFAAISLAPPADAAAIAVRGHSSQPSSAVNSYASNVVHSIGNKQDIHFVIPLPARLASQKVIASGTEGQKGEKKKGKKDKNRSKRFDSWGSNLVTRYQEIDSLPPLLQSRVFRDRPTTHHEPDVAIHGLNDHVEFGRSPNPHHHHHHHGDVDKVIIKGNNDNVHLGRSPEPHHHHHHPGDYIDKVIVKGNNDNVHFNRSPEPHHHHHHHHHGDHVDKVIVKGNNDNVHVGRSPEPHHHHHHHHHHGDHVDKVIVKGNNDNVHVGRSPEPHHHHHHHGDHVDKVVVKGNNDNIHLDNKRGVYINDVQSNESYIVTHPRRNHGHQQRKVVRVTGDNLNKDVSMMRRAEAIMEGVPGTVDIMSQVIHQSSGTRIASLVLVHPDESMASSMDVNATWILNASEKNFTQVYLVPVISDGIATNGTSKREAGDIPVSLKVPVFDPDSASMVSYCATFDPNPPAPAPLTAEPCFSGDSTPPRKSQVFQYTPASGVLSPTWFKGEDDGSSDESNDAAPEDPRTPEDTGVASITGVGEGDKFKSSSGDFGNATAPASSSDNGATNSTTNDASPQDGLRARSQNVTMIFSPAIPAGLSSLKSDNGAASPLANNTDGPTSAGGLNTTDGSNRSSEGSTTTGSSGSTRPSQQSAEELNVMVGVARAERTLDSADPVMTPVSTAPYEWKFSRERS